MSPRDERKRHLTRQARPGDPGWGKPRHTYRSRFNPCDGCTGCPRREEKMPSYPASAWLQYQCQRAIRTEPT